MKFFGLGLTILFVVITSSQAFAGRKECAGKLSQLMDKVETDVRSMKKTDAEVHKYCVMWLYQRHLYDKAKTKNGGEEPCPSSSKDWRGIMSLLMTAYSSAKTICADKKVCTKGCGEALSIIRSGGSQDLALKSIPKDN